jgi:MFS family permease
VGLAVILGFSVTFWFAGLEVTYRLFTEDGFAMTVAETGRVFGLVGVVGAIVQGGLIHRLSRRFGEVRLLQAGTVILAAGLGVTALAPDLAPWGRATLFAGAVVLATGSALINPSLSSYVSRQARADSQGGTLGVMQSMSALARVFGPAAGGLLYELLGMKAPYYAGAVGMLVAAALAARLPPVRS